jgi:hypothetical protein
MGTTYGYGSKNEIKEELRSELKVLAERTVGNHWWAVIEHEGKRIIYLALISKTKGEPDWGYKEIPESMGPSYYDCPEALLNLAEEAPRELSKWAAGWRVKCRAYHAARKVKYSVGDAVTIGSKAYEVTSVLTRNRYHVALVSTGKVYRSTSVDMTPVA